MNVVVTGARGFIGQHLLPRLRQEGWALTCLSHEHPQAWPSQVDLVVHLAGRAHVLSENSQNPEQAYRTANVDYALDCARKAIHAGARRFVFLSTVKVHGESAPAGHPFSEQSPPSPQDPYARSKWEAEEKLRELLGERLVILRPCLVYGPGVKANFAALVRWARSPLPLPLASIRNARSLLYVGNLVDAIVTVSKDPRAGGQSYLLSDGENFSTPELLRVLAAAQNKRAHLLPLSPALLQNLARMAGRASLAQRLLGDLCVDSSKLRRDLGWTAPFPARTALALTAQAKESGKP